MIIKNKSWPSILRVQFSRSNFLKLEIFTLIVLVSQFFAIITVVLVVKLRTRVRKEREEIRNLAKSLANLRKVANIICIDRDATRSRIRNSLVFEIFRTGWTAFDERKTIRLLSNSMELCRWKILPRFIGDDLSQFYIENAFNFKMRQFHLSPNTVIVPIVKPRMYLLDCVQYVNGPVEAKPWMKGSNGLGGEFLKS